MGNARRLKLALVFVFGVFVSVVFANSSGLQDGYTGAPGELTCTSCHTTSPLNSGPGSITIEGVPAVYEAEQTYTITVRVGHPSRRRWGFQISAYTDALQTAGTFQLTDPGHTQKVTAGGNTYVGHNNPGTYAGQANGASWSFEWTAPPAGAGLVTFYAAGNASNNNGLDTGDNIYATFAESQPSVLVPPYTNVSAAAGLASAGGANGVAWSDFDGDGDQDLVLPRDGAATLFRNEGGSFSDATAALGLAASGAESAAWGDFDNDGRPDLLVAAGTGPRLFRNESGSGFVDASTAAGLSVLGPATAGAWADYDGDGWLDLFLVLQNGAALMRGGATGVFEDVTAAAGLGGVTGGRAAAWADYDGDGRADLFLATSGAARLFRQTGPGSFADVASTAGLGGVTAGRQGTWIDYDGDLDLDLFVLTDSALRLMRANGNGTFTDVASTVGLAGISGSAVAIDDTDGDGAPDVLVTGPGTDRLLRFSLTTFVDETDKTGFDEFDGVTAVWADYDVDGRVDLLRISASEVELWRNPSLATVVTVRAVTDADGDATDQDTGADRDALGAVVAFDDNNNFATGTRQMRVVNGGGSSAQPPARAHFAAPSGAIVGVRAAFADGEGRQTAVTASASGVVSAILRDPRAAVIETVSYKRKNGTDKLLVDGARFVTDEEAVEVDGRAMTTTKYPSKKRLPDGTSTRVAGTDPNFGAIVPAGKSIRVTTYDETTGARSAPYLFTR
jgi:hypothetical protein